MDFTSVPGQPVTPAPEADQALPGTLTSSPQPVTPAPDIIPLAQANMMNSINQPAAAPVNQQPLSSGHPEIKTGAPVSPETGKIEVIPESPKISPELEEHVERVQRGEVELPGPIDVGEYEGQTVTISPAAPQAPNIVLPLTRPDFALGAKKPISSSWRWLSEWIRRIIFQMPDRTVYRSE